MRAPRWLGFVLIALGAGLAVNSVLGPLLTGRIRYHLGPTLLNQTIGLDAASLPATIAFSAFAAVFSALAVALYRTAFRRSHEETQGLEVEASFHLRLRDRGV